MRIPDEFDGAVVVAMAAGEVVHAAAMRHGFVAAAGAMHVAWLMA